MNVDLPATIIALLTFFGISGLMALSLNLEYGFAGIGVGAAFAGLFSTKNRCAPIPIAFTTVGALGRTWSIT